MVKNIKRIFSILVLIASSILPITSIQAAPLEIEVTDGQIKPIPIAIADFVSTNGDELGRDIAKVITNDLESSGLFVPVNPRGFNQTPESILSEGPNFADWKMLSAECLLVGSVDTSGGEIRVQFRLFDVVRGTQLLGLELSIDPDKWRRLAHMISDQVYSRMTGEDGYFNSQIVFIEEKGPAGKHRKRRLSMMDYDGHNVRHLTDGVETVLTPRISPNNREIAYLAYKNRLDPHVYVYNLETGENKPLGSFSGMSHAPRFSPNGDEIVFSLEKNGVSAIFIKNLRSGQMRQLTSYSDIDVSPCFSPDGQKIIFSSDRSGTSQLYVMNRDGSDVNRITFDGGRHYMPVWSPRSDLIVCVRQAGGQFHIRVMKPDGTEARSVYVDGDVVETPSWSPNGRVILFRKETIGRRGRTRLMSIDLTGRGLHTVKTRGEASDGCWSALLDKVNQN